MRSRVLGRGLFFGAYRLRVARRELGVAGFTWRGVGCESLMAGRWLSTAEKEFLDVSRGWRVLDCEVQMADESR